MVRYDKARLFVHSKDERKITMNLSVSGHHRVRSKAGLFDVGRMVQISFVLCYILSNLLDFRGPTATAFLDNLTSPSLSLFPMYTCTCTLSVLLNGHVINDTAITERSAGSLFICLLMLL